MVLKGEWDDQLDVKIMNWPIEVNLGPIDSTPVNLILDFNNY